MLVRCIKILVAVLLSLTFTISLSKLVLCVWNGWFNADAADYEIFASYPGAAGRHGPSPSSGKSPPYGGASRHTPTIVDEWLDHNQLGKYKQLFRDRGCHKRPVSFPQCTNAHATIEQGALTLICLQNFSPQNSDRTVAPGGGLFGYRFGNLNMAHPA
uniref:Uncharacterized protein n=1 Tax=Anopheles coluzzii TaxID=1518534 RepID=A0A8W7PIR9_ANOCL